MPIETIEKGCGEKWGAFDFDIELIKGALKTKENSAKVIIDEKIKSNFELMSDLNLKDPKEKTDSAHRAATLVSFAFEMLKPAQESAKV